MAQNKHKRDPTWLEKHQETTCINKIVAKMVTRRQTVCPQAPFEQLRHTRSIEKPGAYSTRWRTIYLQTSPLHGPEAYARYFNCLATRTATEMRHSLGDFVSRKLSTKGSEARFYGTCHAMRGRDRRNARLIMLARTPYSVLPFYVLSGSNISSDSRSSA